MDGLPYTQDMVSATTRAMTVWTQGCMMALSLPADDASSICLFQGDKSIILDLDNLDVSLHINQFIHVMGCFFAQFIPPHCLNYNSGIATPTCIRLVVEWKPASSEIMHLVLPTLLNQR